MARSPLNNPRARENSEARRADDEELRDAFLEQIRVSRAFERVAAASLWGAITGGVVVFAGEIAIFLALDFAPFTAIGRAVFSALIFAALAFLIGFAAGGLGFSILTKRLGSESRRRASLFYIAALVIAGVAVAIADAAFPLAWIGAPHLVGAGAGALVVTRRFLRASARDFDEAPDDRDEPPSPAPPRLL